MRWACQVQGGGAGHHTALPDGSLPVRDLTRLVLRQGVTCWGGGGGGGGSGGEGWRKWHKAMTFGVEVSRREEGLK